MKKILLLFCGGTIIMKKNRRGVLATPGKVEAVDILRGIEPRLSEIADFSIQYIANLDSTNMTPSDWDRIIHAIRERYEEADAFVITHGTDTMAYTAAALSVAISGLDKPVILTGSQIPGWEIGTDARRNLVSAFQVAMTGIHGVYIVFDERIILGGRATKASESKLDAFTTVNDRDAGEIRIDISFHNNPQPEEKKHTEFHPGFEPDIFVYTLTPGADAGDLEFMLQNDRIKGIILLAYGTGNLPDRFNPFFEKARKQKVPVVVTSQCLHGMTRMQSYEVGRQALERGVIEGYDQSLEALTVKLMWALRHVPYQKIASIIHTNFSGELKKK